jgi:D-methionine transport system substrate-binding protein
LIGRNNEEIFVVINGAAISLEACVNSGSGGELAQVSVASRGTDVEIWDFIAESDVLA